MIRFIDVIYAPSFGGGGAAVDGDSESKDLKCGFGCDMKSRSNE